MLRSRTLLALLFALPLSLAAQTSHWDYEGKYGTTSWPRLSPENRICGTGHEQAPIDIRGARINKALKPITFGYAAGPMTLVNDGHTIVVTPTPGSYVLFNETRYDLVSFSFHHPSEITVKGKLSDMEVQLLHKSAEGKLLIFSIRLNEGTPNAVIAPLWEHMPKKAGTTDQVKDELNPAGLLPANRAYWTFTGSLTTPPCTEGVQWVVFEDEKDISRDQLKAFAALFKFNSRTLQNPHGRKIQAFE